MELTRLKTIVIGAGVGGLATALALHRRGADVTVLEQAPEITEVGAGLQISPNGGAVLRGLGLGPALEAAGVTAQAVCLHDYRNGTPVLRLDLTGDWTVGRYHFLHRADLIDLLAEAVRAAGIKIRLLQQVDTVIPGETPEIVLATGDRLHGDLVLGADGLHSRLRPVLNGPQKAFFTGQVAWRAVIPNVLDHPPVARVHMGPHRHVVSYPLRGGRHVNLVAVQERAAWAAEGWSQTDDPSTLKRVFADFGGTMPAMLDAVTRVGVWGLFRHPVADRWYGDGTALVGDAAHPTLPFLAQGANMALEDAWVLADALAGATTRAEGLARYQARRHARARKVIATANGNAWKYHLSFPPLRLAAHTALRVAGRVAPDRMLRQFDWLYGHDVTAAG